ncbi:MAG: hypothetical protein COZ91_02325 [Candidatus Nealsonbacteria bacterium CG_4_8_14_3_um_filter_39_7]|nr:MAG: hypothetical protein COS96_02945 [Candidatus Nealsonbacteria bacterium CG07_land_8_20_14_0_80_39_13]PIW91092.1 MAG: hypothetical protein COZ91_02325 [Candidatus Nealsonbacteria bacterium CG_4_8_14_3_um_filter_39_7]
MRKKIVIISGHMHNEYYFTTAKGINIIGLPCFYDNKGEPLKIDTKNPINSESETQRVSFFIL